MKEVLFSLILGGIGVLLMFWGYRFARILLALWGLSVGFVAGMAVIADLFGSEFFGTVLGVLTGLVLGLLFGALAYLYYSVAVLLLGAGVGYAVGSSFITFFGIDPGFISATVGVLVGLVFGLAAIVYNLPKVFLIVLSSVAGAVVAISAILVLFNQIPLDYYSYAAARSAVADSWIWSISAIVLAALGMVTQFVTTTRYEMAVWSSLNEANNRPGGTAHPVA
jgi:hypothetical protein